MKYKNWMCSVVQPQQEKLIKEIINLRYKILREPLGLSFSDDELLLESINNYFLAISDIESQDLIGTLLLQIADDPSQLKMRQVAIRPDLQRMGYGRLLVQFSEDFAKSIKIKRLVLHARKSAIPFYVSLGYSFKDECFIEVGIEHYYMWKDITTQL
jgi:predicted GNAT family N-acyltransferase